tara:strand:- start:859 stop:981 length:123 start_codon:yes stop_codon:yes gene_type:complete
VSVKVSYTYCEWSDREEIRNKFKKSNNQDLKKEKEKENGN